MQSLERDIDIVILTPFGFVDGRDYYLRGVARNEGLELGLVQIGLEIRQIDCMTTFLFKL